jgi:hypothetical protein
MEHMNEITTGKVGTFTASRAPLNQTMGVIGTDVAHAISGGEEMNVQGMFVKLAQNGDGGGSVESAIFTENISIPIRYAKPNCFARAALGSRGTGYTMIVFSTAGLNIRGNVRAGVNPDKLGALLDVHCI